MTWHNRSIEEVKHLLNTNLTDGLTSKEANKRLKEYGPNELTGKKNTSMIQKFFEQFADFMIITLIFAAIISFVVSLLNGELDFVDPVIILLIITLNAILGVIQESKAERSLEALKKMSAPTATVIRDGTVLTIPSSNLVPGDIIKLESGCFVPADARIIESANLKVEEASLTGESHPVDKVADAVLVEDTLIGDRKNMLMSTSIVTYGRGTAIVVGTGMNTEVGHIATLILEDDTPMTPLQKRLAGTSKVLGLSALGICVFIFIIGVIKGRPIFDMFMTAVSLAVAAIPEGLPAIVTIMLSLGVQRMAKKNAVIRKLPAVETLGSATVICSDKTGTLTQNLMTVTDIASAVGKESPVSSFGEKLLTYGSLCNDAIIQIENNEAVATGEPTEKAIVLAAYRNKVNKSKLDLNYPRVYEIPFDSTRKLMTTVHSTGKQYRSITKGAFDVLLTRCNFIEVGGKIVTLDDRYRQKLIRQNTEMTSKALRVLGVAYKDISLKPSSRTENSLEHELVFLGLIGMIDPPRKEVIPAVKTCKGAGIIPVMITGDHINTACAIAKQIGILGENEKAISGAELSKLSNEEFCKHVEEYRVFARVSPEHKVRIVKAFQSKDNVVAMTGDGVNDAPALKAADIGCAMGQTGTDVAKNASDMVLSDDNFSTIVSAVKEGRGIYDNIRKSIHFLLSSNIGEILIIFIAILLGYPSPLLAVQLLWVNLVTDSLPAIALGVDPADKDIMKRKPISSKQGMFANGLAIRIIGEGIMIGMLALLAFTIGLRCYDYIYAIDTIPAKTGCLNLHEITPHVGRTMAFAVLSLSELFHAFNMRSEHSIFKIGIFSNMKLLISFFVCTFLQIAVITIRPLSRIFKVVPLTASQWIIVFILSFMPIVIVEIQKYLTSNLKSIKRQKLASEELVEVKPARNEISYK